jgi:hypothetical protein
MKLLTVLRILILWLLLILRFTALPALRRPVLLTAPRPKARQWIAVRPLAGRIVALRVQVVLV